jgi:hypothetical protein
MTQPRVEVRPEAITLEPGGSADVTVTALDGEGQTGRLLFPVKSRHGQAKGSLQVTTASAVLFGTPENPASLPITITELDSSPTSVTYRIAAAPLEELSRSDRRRLRRG